ncbi:MAG: alpha/beta hydrolase [Bacteroidota bacterium]
MSELPILFAHANGFPGRAYTHFLEQLAPWKTDFIPVFGMGKYQVKRDWTPLADELIEYVETHHPQGVIALGHSLGAVVSLWAGSQRPELFHRLILLDPPLFGPGFQNLVWLLQMLGLSRRFNPLARQALARKAHFTSIEEAREYWGGKNFFKPFHPQCFEDYLTHGLMPDPEGGYTLRFPAELEARIFSSRMGRGRFHGMRVAADWILAERSVLPASTQARHRKRFSADTFYQMKGGHMFPMESPVETAAMIKKILSSDMDSI